MMSLHETLAAMKGPCLVASQVPEALALPPRGPSLATRREALRKALVLRPWMSDRVLARWCNVSRELVASTRRRMIAAGEIRTQPDVLGGDGKRYPTEP